MARPLSLLALSLLLHLVVLEMVLDGSGKQTAVVTPSAVAMMLFATTPSLLPAKEATQPLAQKSMPKVKSEKGRSTTPRAAPPAPHVPSSDALTDWALANNPEKGTLPIQTEKIAEAMDGSGVQPDGAADPAFNTAAETMALEATVASVTAEKKDSNLPASAAAQIRFDLPPSAILSYEVRYATKGSITHGTSVINWQASEYRYSIEGEITKFGFTLSSFRSQGDVGSGGIAPVMYLEKNARRAETTTHFQRDASQTIFFSTSAGATPLVSGAQDRASILWQLAGIASAGKKGFDFGTRLDILVAGVRDAEYWKIDVLGEEIISVEAGPMRAWHMVRAPRPGTKDKRIDIWLAPDQHWYPVKLRYTEFSGDYLDLSLATIQ